MNGGSVDLLWDAGACGVAESPRAGTLTVGGRSGWSPTELLSLAIESDLMALFLERTAESLTVLGFVSAVQLHDVTGGDTGYEAEVRPCVILARAGDEPVARRLMVEALGASAVCASLKRVRLEPEFVIARPETDGDADACRSSEAP